MSINPNPCRFARLKMSSADWRCAHTRFSNPRVTAAQMAACSLSNFIFLPFLKVTFAPKFIGGSWETNRDEGERRGNWRAIGKCLLAVREIGRVISISQQWLALPICRLDRLLLLWLQCSLFNVALEISSFVLLNPSLTVLRTGAAFYPRTKP